MNPLYILMRNQDYAYKPDEQTGWFNLGSLLTKPMDPESLLEGYSIITPEDDMPIQHPWKEDFQSGNEEGKSRGYGIFAKFLETLPVPLGFSAANNNESISRTEVNLKRLETYFMTPTKQYLNRVLSTPAAQKYLREQKYFKNLYIVTGIRVAKHANGLESIDKTSKTEVGVSIDVGAVTTGVPNLLDVGPRFNHGQQTKRVQEFAACSDYIYAYRLAKIRYSRREKGPKLSYQKGELFDLGLDLKPITKEQDDTVLECEDLVNEEWVPYDALTVGVEDEGGESCKILIEKVMS